MSRVSCPSNENSENFFFKKFWKKKKIIEIFSKKIISGFSLLGQETPQPQLVGFCDFVEVGIAPVSKKLLLSQLQSKPFEWYRLYQCFPSEPFGSAVLRTTTTGNLVYNQRHCWQLETSIYISTTTVSHLVSDALQQCDSPAYAVLLFLRPKVPDKLIYFTLLITVKSRVLARLI